LVKAINSAFEDPEELQAMSARAASLARPDAAERIVQECAALISDSEKGA
jgi:UDP-N-acetylglucosamine:LPS N-acetylglucosamine transferase